MLGELWQRLKGELNQPELAIAETRNDEAFTIQLRGVATARTIDPARACFESVVRGDKNVTLDLSELRYLDARFLGLLIMLRKQLQSRGLSLRLVGANGWVVRAFR